MQNRRDVRKSSSMQLLASKSMLVDDREVVTTSDTRKFLFESSRFPFRTKERLQSLNQFVKEKARRPNHSQTHDGKIEVLIADDDPINQVTSFYMLVNICYFCDCALFLVDVRSLSISSRIYSDVCSGWQRSTPSHSVAWISAGSCYPWRADAREDRLWGDKASHSRVSNILYIN